MTEKILDMIVLVVCCIVLLPVFAVVEFWSHLQTVARWVKKKFVWWVFERSRERRQAKEREKIAEAKKWRNAVEPLPRVRPRALTLHSRVPLPEKGLAAQDASFSAQKKTGRKRREIPCAIEPRVVKQTTTDQLGNCDLWKLPYEVREEIWKYAVGGHHIHIVRRKGRLGNVYCPAEEPLDPLRRDLCILKRDEQGYYRPTAWPKDARPLALMLSCRQMYSTIRSIPCQNHCLCAISYSETIDLLYDLNTFSFDEADTLLLFFETLLPHRRNLISSLHLTPNLNTYRSRPQSKILAELYEPPRSTLTSWAKAVQVLNMQANLRSLAVIPVLSFLGQGGWPQGSVILNCFRVLNEARVDGKFTFTFPDDPSGTLLSSEPRLRGPWAFEVLELTRGPAFQLMCFLVPFNVQCLHCSSYVIIRKATKGFCEATLIRAESDFSFGADADGQPKLGFYWTFHSYCGGWMEFQYDWGMREWSVTQGGRELSEREAAKHLAEHGRKYPVLESAHERYNRLAVKTWSGANGSWHHSGRTIDEPMRKAFYRNVGWARN